LEDEPCADQLPGDGAAVFAAENRDADEADDTEQAAQNVIKVHEGWETGNEPELAHGRVSGEKKFA
jgi:hypothetical protein